ncbi:DUF1508 domain-containing protein [Chroococcus sp. FPU101]|uniref:YegP family protein n=1 Tax=Chroococcus sp. FPU101 TaxID=1974212 RepID=UPI001A8FA6B7|nr:DUF1508 domain-containing protein [Chroococcus sp. FPU101]
MIKEMYYKVYQDNARLWRWTFYASNSEPIAVSSESYTTLLNCKNAIKIVQSSNFAPIKTADGRLI